MTANPFPKLGQTWQLVGVAPWLLRPLGSRVVVRGVSETHVGYRYLDGGEGVQRRDDWLLYFSFVDASDDPRPPV